MKALPKVEVVPEFIPFAGGLDVVTPALAVSPGYVRSAQNFEQSINGGYQTVAGYERYSGQPRPSDATYSILTCTITGTVNIGDILTDNSGANFGTVISLPTGQAVLTKMTGHFIAGNIKVGGVVQGTCAGAEVINGASTALLAAQYTNLAAAQYRNDIAAVPGSGAIRGVWLYNDIVYAFRDNAGGTATVMFKATVSGWSAVALGRELNFITGSAAVSEGQTLTGAISGASAVVTRIALESGTYGASTAKGHFVFASVTGAFQNGENLQVGGLTKAVASGVDAAMTFAVPSGRFEFVNYNFGGSVNTKRMYGCDGNNRGFEFDGNVFVFINTGMTSDKPQHIAAHKNQLFLSFIGSVQNSSVGLPYQWSPVTGASEIAMGDQVTGFMVQPGGANEGALSIFTRRNVSTLYGSSVADWKLTPFNQNAGGIAYTIQRIGQTMMLDSRGISNLMTTQAYGNFVTSSLSRRIQPYLTTRRSSAIASCVMRDKVQYRLFFSDGSAVFVTLDNANAAGNAMGIMPSVSVVGMMPILYPNPASCACSEEMSDGTEIALFGGTNGFVYQMEKGTSFDGTAIETYLYMVFNHSQGPMMLKRYRRARFEVSGTGYAEFNFSYELGYGTTDIDQPGIDNYVEALLPAYWDTFTWDSFIWDGKSLLPQDVEIVGEAENVSLKISSNSAYFSPLKVSGVVLQYTPRRRLR